MPTRRGSARKGDRPSGEDRSRTDKKTARMEDYASSVKSYSPQMWILQLPSYLQPSCWKEHVKHDEDNVQ